ncbi:MAG: deoxyribonuclease V [Actinomycetota bacterium]|nr:deoxyribonuclease V [Actinomycetota bacterium]
MKPAFTHRFRVSPKKAIEIQRELSSLVVEKKLVIRNTRLVAGADVSYSKSSNRVHAAVVVLSFPELAVIEERTASCESSFPYIPGLLAFREAPPLLLAFRRLKNEPDVVLFDGHGIAHPRSFGIASHMGVILGVPAVGVAKSILVGEYRMPDEERGQYSPVLYNEKTVGIALRTRNNVKPVFVSVGNLIDLDSAREITLSCCTRYRLPEPIRAAHNLGVRQ